MTTVPCSWARDRLELFPGGDLPASEDAALRGHLMECLDCRKSLSPMVRAHHALREEIPPDAIPAGVRPDLRVERGFFAAMHRAIMAQVRSLPVPGLRPTRSGAAAAVMVAAALFLSGLGAVSFLERPPANLLERGPIQIGQPPPAEPSLLVTVGLRPSWWQGLMGRQKAMNKLLLEPDKRR